jgi:hypothetical protein
MGDGLSVALPCQSFCRFDDALSLIENPAFVIFVEDAFAA